MEELLPYYERELSFLRRYSRDFAERYPKIAARLAMSGEHCEDPHVERMIESFALLGARINKKLDDDYPEFTEALLEVLYPHYLRPFPSCSIAQLGNSAALSHLTEPVTIERGTELKSRPIRGVQCRFRTAYDVTLAPVRISEAKYTSVAMAPSATVLPGNATAIVSITFESTAAQLDLSALKVIRCARICTASSRSLRRSPTACSSMQWPHMSKPTGAEYGRNCVHRRSCKQALTSKTR